MNFFDFLFIGGGGAVIGVLAHVFYLELKATGKIKPAITATEAKVEGLGLIVEHNAQAALANFNPEKFKEWIKTMLTDALNELKAAADADKAKAVADAVAAATGPAVDAAKAADEQTVRDFTAANFPPA